MGTDDKLTIDDLAQRSGVSSRNIRYYQTRGLLPPPRVKGRTGTYDARHMDRLALISELKAEGLNLQAIGFLLGGSSQVDTGEVRSLKRAILDSWMVKPPEEVRLQDLLKRLRLRDEDAGLLERAIAIELIELTDDPNVVRILLPDILDAGDALLEMGVSFVRSLDVLEGMRAQALQVAKLYVDLFDGDILGPWEARGRPASEWKLITQWVERLRPIAGEALLAVFNQVIGGAITDSIAASAPD